MRFRLRHSVIAIVGSLGCTAAAEHSPQRSAPNAAATGTVAAGTVVVDSQPPAATAVRALYVNRWASQSRKRMTKLVGIADSTEINALVIDMKDEFGLNYTTKNSEFAKN